MKRLILSLAAILLAALAPNPAHGVDCDPNYTEYGTTPTIQIPKGDCTDYDVPLATTLKGMTDFTAIFANSDGTLKATATATPWQQVTGPVTWLSTTSFKVPETLLFEEGRKVWVSQAVDVIGVVESTSTAAGETTVTLSDIVLYSDNTTASTLTDPITSVSVSMVTPRSTPAASTFLALADTPSSYTANSRLRVNSAGTAVEEYAVPCFRAEAVGGQVIATDTWTKVQLTDESFDPTGAFDATTNYRFQPLVAGYYKIDAAIRINSYTSGDVIGARIYKNGATYSTAFVAPYSTAENVIIISISDRVYFNGSTDYVELFVYQGHGSNLAVQSATTVLSGCLER